MHQLQILEHRHGVKLTFLGDRLYMVVTNISMSNPDTLLGKRTSQHHLAAAGGTHLQWSNCTKPQLAGNMLFFFF